MVNSLPLEAERATLLLLISFMKFLKGKKIADEILRNIKLKIEKEKLGIGLAVILVGEDEASRIYTRLKNKAAEKAGINFFEYEFDDRGDRNDLENRVIKKIKELNVDEKVSGMIVQLPLPEGLDTRKIINSIDPRKDADGFHSENVKLFFKNKEKVWPVFPRAIIKMIESAGVKLSGKKAVIIANSEKFGEIMAKALRRKNMKSRYFLADTFIRSSSALFADRQASFQREKGVIGEIKKADIIISACGIPSLIKGGIIKKGAIIIDGGVTKRGKKVLGDVNAGSVKNIAGYISPVPGGVGPVTVACLLENVYILANRERI